MHAPAFQFYVADFLLGTITMSAEEVGGYIRLLCHQWDKGSLPDDDTHLRRLAGVRPSAIAAIRSKFERGSDGQLRNVRLELERKKQADFREEKSAVGRQGAMKRWQVKTNSKPNAEALPTQCPPNAVALPDQCPPTVLAMPNHSSSSSSSSSSSVIPPISPASGGPVEPSLEQNPPSPPPPKGKRTRAPKPGSVFADEQSDDLHRRMLALGGLFNRREKSPWSADEFAAIALAGYDRMPWEEFVAELDLLEPFFAAPDPADDPDGKDRNNPLRYRQTTLLTLLRHRGTAVDRARAWSRTEEARRTAALPPSARGSENNFEASDGSAA